MSECMCVICFLSTTPRCVRIHFGYSTVDYLPVNAIHTKRQVRLIRLSSQLTVFPWLFKPGSFRVVDMHDPGAIENTIKTARPLHSDASFFVLFKGL